MSLPQGTNPFPSGLAAQTQDSSSRWFQEKLGGFCSSAWLGCHQAATRRSHAESRPGGDVEGARGEAQPFQQEPEVPHCVCSALTGLGELQGGEVNIVRRGGASLGGLLPTSGGPASSAPAGCWGPAGTWKNPGAEHGAGLGVRVCKSCKLWWGSDHSPAWPRSLLFLHPMGGQSLPSWEPTCTCLVLSFKGGQNRVTSAFLHPAELS